MAAADQHHLRHNASSANGTSCSPPDSLRYVLLPVGYALVCAAALALNGAALYLMVFRTARRKPSTVYMLNLSACDTLYALTLPFLVYYHARRSDWPFSEAFCKLLRFLFYANLYASILFLCCISLQRCLGVCRPLLALRWESSRQAWLVCAGVWAGVLLGQAPVLYFSRTREKKGGMERICYDATSPELFLHFLTYSSLVSVVMFALPFVAVAACYGLMVRKLLQPGWGEGGEQGGGQGGGGPAASRSKRRAVKMIVVVLTTFVLCFLPYHLTRSLHLALKYLRQQDPGQVCYVPQVSCDVINATSLAYKVTRLMASANSCMDPILYFLAGQRFRGNHLPKAGRVKSSVQLESIEPTNSHS